MHGGILAANFNAEYLPNQVVVINYIYIYMYIYICIICLEEYLAILSALF